MDEEHRQMQEAAELVISSRRRGEAEMRERAAKLASDAEPISVGDPRRFQDQIADAIRALPLSSDQENR